MRCKTCGNETENPSFCGRSCAAKFNNAHHPKRKKEGRCRKCGGEIRASRRYCSTCRKIVAEDRKRLMASRRCVICGRAVGDRRRRRCNSCNTKVRRYRTKLAIVSHLGGRCVKCGWAGPVSGFDLHHRDPSKKDFRFGQALNRSWSLVRREVEKCDLLCALCHRLEHAPEDDAALQKEVGNYGGRAICF